MENTIKKESVFVGEYKPSIIQRTTLFELSTCSHYGRHPKITKAPGKFIVFKVLIRKHYGMEFFYEDDKYWYFKG